MGIYQQFMCNHVDSMGCTTNNMVLLSPIALRQSPKAFPMFRWIFPNMFPYGFVVGLKIVYTPPPGYDHQIDGTMVRNHQNSGSWVACFVSRQHHLCMFTWCGKPKTTNHPHLPGTGYEIPQNWLFIALGLPHFYIRTLLCQGPNSCL